MTKLLIPTDFSENALNAIRYALEFFKYQKTKFYFMHAYQTEVYNHKDLVTRDDYKAVLARVKKQSETNLETLLQTVKQLSPNPNFEYITISANNALVDEADVLVDSKNIDLIVMGTKGQSNTNSITFGSNTLQVLKYVKCPVLAIPKDYKYSPPKQALFPTNFLIPYKRRELKLLCDLLAPYRTKIELLYVSRSSNLSLRQEDNKTFLEQTVCKNELTYNSIEGKNIEATINTYATKNKFDFIIMVNTQHSYLENILFHSTVDKVSLKIGAPLLVMQNLRR